MPTLNFKVIICFENLKKQQLEIETNYEQNTKQALSCTGQTLKQILFTTDKIKHD